MNPHGLTKAELEVYTALKHGARCVNLWGMTEGNCVLFRRSGKGPKRVAGAVLDRLVALGLVDKRMVLASDYYIIKES